MRIEFGKSTNSKNINENVKFLVEQARTCDADILVFPECYINGYPIDDLAIHEGYVKQSEEAVERVVEASTKFDVAVVFGAITEFDAKVKKSRNSLIFVQGGKLIHKQSKYALADYGVFYEQRTFIPARKKPEPIEYKGKKLGFLICESLWFEESYENLKGADVIISINASPFTVNKTEQRLEVAKKVGVPVIYCNQFGASDGLVFDGENFEIDAKGNYVRYENQLLMDYTDKYGSILEAVIFATAQYFERCGVSKALLGLSGGIDSALVMYIAVKALGAKNVSTYMLSTQYTSQTSFDDAKDLADNLNCTHEIINIEPMVESYHDSLGSFGEIGDQNIQSRVRGVILMALSNKSGAFLLSTGNKSEMAVGYATLYGDMNGAFNPLKDIYKTDVYELCRYINKKEGNEVIPVSIINKEPSAELKDDQKDSDNLPGYDVLDAILKELIDNRKMPSELYPEFTDKTVDRVYKMLKNSEFKRYQATKGTIISDTPLDRAWMYQVN